MMPPGYDRIAELDQVSTDLAQWATVYGSFRTALMDNGFDEDDALHIMLGWQEGMMQIQATKESAIIFRDGHQ